MVHISFEDGTWTKIPLMTPFPKTPEEMDSIVRQFALPKEVAEARLEPHGDLSFITEMIGKERETKRNVMRNPVPEGLEEIK